MFFAFCFDLMLRSVGYPFSCFDCIGLNSDPVVHLQRMTFRLRITESWGLYWKPYAPVGKVDP